MIGYLNSGSPGATAPNVAAFRQGLIEAGYIEGQNLAKLADKIARQALIEADRTKIGERLAFTRENYRIVRERLMKIVTWKPGDDGRRPWATEVTEAGKAIVAMDLAILKAEIENGLYKKPDEVIVGEFR